MPFLPSRSVATLNRAFRSSDSVKSKNIGGRFDRLPRSPVPEYQYMDIENRTTPATWDSLTRDDIIIAVMGPTKSGKSTFIETATGLKGLAGHGIESYTSECRALRIAFRGSNVVLVDTPGFDDTYRSDLDILKLISRWLRDMYESGLFLSGILYLHCISEPRMAGTLVKNLEMFKKLCGEDAHRRTVLVTTMWEDVDLTIGIERETMLKQDYWKTMIDAGSVTRRFEQRTRKAAWDILNYVITQEPDTRVRIPELVDRSIDLPKPQVLRGLYQTRENLPQQEVVVGRQRDSKMSTPPIKRKCNSVPEVKRKQEVVVGRQRDSKMSTPFIKRKCNSVSEVKRKQDEVVAGSDMRSLDSSFVGRLRRLFRIGQ